jgi:hypothetical protein
MWFGWLGSGSAPENSSSLLGLIVLPSFTRVIRPRRAAMIVDVAKLLAERNLICGLLEVDVTNVRRRIRELNREGSKVSFTAWMTKVVADCVARHPQTQAMLHGRRRMVVFKDVDIALPVEKLVGRIRQPLPLLIRECNKKSLREINREIQGFKNFLIIDESEYFKQEQHLPEMVQSIYYHLPKILRLATLRHLLFNPFRSKRYSGTVFITTVNAVGSLKGWTLPTRPNCNLSVALGSVAEKPWVVNGEIKIRQILNLTISMNHDVIDGVPARQFTQDLVSEIESNTSDILGSYYD